MTNSPILHSERLQYSPQEEWGGEEDGHMGFCDRPRRTAARFTVSREGVPIGSCVLDRFDFRGGAELSLDLQTGQKDLPLMAEAVVTVANWGLYQLHLEVVRAKCAGDEALRQEIFEDCFHCVEKDGAFSYFEKQI